MKKDNYDFDLVLTREQFEKNKKNNIILKSKNNIWQKYLIYIILPIIGAYLGIATYQLFTKTEIKKTEMGYANCKGGLIKVCNGNEQI